MQQHVGILTLPSEKDFSGSLLMYVQHATVLFCVQHVHSLCRSSLKRISGHASARIPEYLAAFRNFWWQTSRILRQKYFWTKEKGFAIPQAVGGPTSQSMGCFHYPSKPIKFQRVFSLLYRYGFSDKFLFSAGSGCCLLPTFIC